MHEDDTRRVMFRRNMCLVLANHPPLEAYLEQQAIQAPLQRPSGRTGSGSGAGTCFMAVMAIGRRWAPPVAEEGGGLRAGEAALQMSLSHDLRELVPRAARRGRW
jgi:hypothetical protein